MQEIPAISAYVTEISTTLRSEMAFLDKNVIFRPYFELEAIAGQSVEDSREFICAFFGNIYRQK